MYAILIPHNDFSGVPQEKAGLRIVVQRVTEASVEVEGAIAGRIGPGLLVLLGVERSDDERAADYLARKTLGLRIFDDEQGRMNRSVMDAGGALLVVSQFTLYGDCDKGMRPSFDRAARPEQARELYQRFVQQLRAAGARVETGVFQASMRVALINDGPVTIICNSKNVADSKDIC